MYEPTGCYRTAGTLMPEIVAAVNGKMPVLVDSGRPLCGDWTLTVSLAQRGCWNFSERNSRLRWTVRESRIWTLSIAAC